MNEYINATDLEVSDVYKYVIDFGGRYLISNLPVCHLTTPY
jgi:hypothetical protein